MERNKDMRLSCALGIGERLVQESRLSQWGVWFLAETGMGGAHRERAGQWPKVRETLELALGGVNLPVTRVYSSTMLSRSLWELVLTLGLPKPRARQWCDGLRERASLRSPPAEHGV